MKLKSVNFIGFFCVAVLVMGISDVACATTPTESVIRLTANVNDLESKCVKSNDFELNSLFWRIELCKSSNFVNATLVSYLTSDAPKWSCSAEAVFRLHSQLKKQELESKMPKRKFDIANPSHGITEFVKWDEMLANYVHENQSYFEVTISTDRPIRSFQSENTSLSSAICFKNVRTLGIATSYVLPHFVVRGIRWKIGVLKRSTHLQIYLFVEEDDLARTESWEATAKFTLLPWSQSLSVRNITKSYTRRFGKNYATNWGFGKFLEWNEFINPNNEYIKNGTAWFNVDITVSKPKLG